MPLSNYVDSLFGEPADAGPSARPTSSTGEDLGEWQAFIDQWEAEHHGEQETSDEDEPYFPSTPWPSVLDHLKAGESSTAQAPLSPHETSPPLPSGAVSPSPNGLDVDLSLLDRLRIHLPVSSTFSSLIGLLSSSRSNEEIQSELVEILGFEGEGLQLVEELLRPGARDRVVQESGLVNGKGSKKASGTSTPRGQYLPSARLTVNAAKGKEKKHKIDLADMIGSSDDIARRIQEQLERPKAMFSEGGPRIVEQEVLPHVYTSAASTSASMSMGGRFAMPSGTIRDMYDTFEEVTIPPSKPVPPRISERPVRITELPPLARGCFPKYVTLNRMQSIVQPTAMNTNENMLVCAPTGAGKTDVALMSIIRVLQHHVRSTPSTHPSGFDIDRDAFKVIYVAPMKALAAEITRKFGKRLAWLGIKVRELTGDMQLTKQEIAETQIIITTPEKWDVVTRKPTGEGELASKVKLLIIDEVHLLNEERGAVIETIVARTLRQVESSQSLIRIVGLSATLPNYIDVSDFLRVNRYTGLFFFDASFRPVPLEQHFIGVAGKPRSQASLRNMDKVVFDKAGRVAELVQEGHQVMVFVHARKETVKSATKLKEMALEEGMSTFFETREHPRFEFYRREISTSRNREMKELFDSGFGIHHAGMLRSDRNMMEKMFEDQAIKVLCCTSTLAWGVNLPAHAVIIKGTQVYDSSRGAFMDLSVLDVLQIFGRAGRPGYETSGVGYICTTQDKLEHYLYTIMAQHPIESKFIPGMVDSLNAEVSLGTITNVQEAIQWLGYTYLFVRMRKEPFIYGKCMPHDELKDDPQLGNKRNELIVQAARQLSTAKMIRYDEVHNSFVISDLGRIAAKYYLRHQTMEIFNEMFHPKMKNADLFAMLSQATEFDQIQVRENEVDELTAILESDHCPMEVKGGVTNKHGKVNILLQAHISKVFIEDFALVSDAAYVAQNAARIIRALLEIALSRNWANDAILLIDLSKAIERRTWPYEHPLTQIPTLQKETLYNLRRWADDTEVHEFRDMDVKTAADLIHMNEKHGAAIRDAALMFPTVGITHSLRPLSHDLLQISVLVEPQFTWNAKLSGSIEPFYIWIQDADGVYILQWRNVLLRPTTTAVEIEFVIPLGDNPPASLTIVSASDKWLGSDEQRALPLQDLVMPQPPPESTPLLDTPFLHISCLQDAQLERAYRPFITTLNAIQSQAFWTAYHTQNNVLLSAPVASGKSFLGEVAIWHAFRHEPDASVLVIVPSRRSVQETAARIRSVAPVDRKIAVLPLNKPSDFDKASSSRRQVLVTSPSELLQLDRARATAFLRQQSLFVLEDLHLLDEQYELAVTGILTVAKPARTRVFGIASSLNDPSDLASWLCVDEASRFAFYPSDRGTPITLSLKTFTIPHSSTLLKAMIKPAYDILKSSIGGAIIFVPSRSAARSVAADLVTQSGTEMDLNGFLGAPRADVEPLVQRLRDQALLEPLLHGIGYIVPGMAPHDLALVLELFASGIIRALIAPREACWTLPLRGQTVVLMGAQYLHFSDAHSHELDRPNRADRADRQIVNYSRVELVRMQGYATISASPHAASGRMFVMCQAEQQMIITRVLNDGLPLESSLPALLSRKSSTPAQDALARMLKPRVAPPRPQINRPIVPDLRKRDMMDLIAWTYLSKRIRSNPTYYDLTQDFEEEGLSRLVDKWFVNDEYTDPAPLEGARRKDKSAAAAAAAAAINGEAKEGASTKTRDDGSRDNVAQGDADVEMEVVGDATIGEADGETMV